MATSTSTADHPDAPPAAREKGSRIRINIDRTSRFPIRAIIEFRNSARSYDMSLPTTDFVAILDRIKTYYPHPTLTRLTLVDRPGADVLFTKDDLRTVRSHPMLLFESFLHFAVAKSVTEMELRFHHPFPETCVNPPIPYPLLICSTLTSLKLTSLSFPKLSQNFQGFPYLKTLHLRFILFRNSQDVSRLFSLYCPSLQSLVIEKCHWIPNVTVTPRSFPNLERFKFVDHADSSPENLNTEAPKLLCLYFSGAIECLNLRNCPRLHTANIHSSGRGLLSCQRVMKIAELCANVQVLIVGYWFFPHFNQWHWQWKEIKLCRDYPPCDLATYPVPVFENLREFHCHGILVSKFTMRALLVFVCNCPLLEMLCINLDFYKPGLPDFSEREEFNAKFNSRSTEKDILEDYDYRGPKQYDSWEEVLARRKEEQELLHHPDLKLKLKSVTSTQFSDDCTCMRMLKFILEKSPALEKLQVNFVQQQHIELEQLRQEISSFPRASPFENIIDVSQISVLDYEEGRGKCSPLNEWFAW